MDDFGKKSDLYRVYSQNSQIGNEFQEIKIYCGCWWKLRGLSVDNRQAGSCSQSLRIIKSEWQTFNFVLEALAAINFQELSVLKSNQGYGFKSRTFTERVVRAFQLIKWLTRQIVQFFHIGNLILANVHSG